MTICWSLSYTATSLSPVSGDLNPGLREEGTGTEHKSDVDSGVNGVKDGFFKSVGRRHVVRDSPTAQSCREPSMGREGKHSSTR